jgi:hypothetical protein
MHNQRTNRRRASRGLSTLEMVLALPILLFIMALMVNFGTVACWKVRALSMARHEAWRARHDRADYSYPRPDDGPAGAVSGRDSHERFQLPGDVVAAVDADRLVPPGAAMVAPDLLDPTRGLRRGWATLDRRYAMLGSLGLFHLRGDNCLLDDKWQYQEMGMSSNGQRRTPLVYALPKVSGESYITTALRLYFTFYRNSPWNDYLAPLDRDAEFLYFSQLFGWGSGAPDFQPRLGRFCSLDRSLVDDCVSRLIDRIQGNKEPHLSDVAERMARAFIALYRRAIQGYQGLSGANPPPPPDQMANIQAQISQLEQKIGVLNQFQHTLEGHHGS